MKERLRVFVLICIMTVVAFGAVGISLFALYDAALEEEKARLVDAARSQVHMMEAVAQFNARILNREVRDLPIQEIVAAYEHFEGFGKTGELILAAKEPEGGVFFLERRHPTEKKRSVTFVAATSEPMRRALSGQAGTMIGIDYRGNKVLAAYEPVPGLGFGLVVKIDLAEIRAPFIRAGLLAGSGALGLVLLGTLVFWKVTSPLLRRLRDSEVKYRSIFEGSPNAVILMTETFEDCNEQACRLWGRSRQEIIGHSPVEFSPPVQPDGKDSAEAAGRHIQAALTGTPQFFYWRHRRQDGTPLDVEVSLKAIQVAGRTVLMGIVRDVTERKRAEARLRERNAFIERILDNLPIGLIVLSLEDRKFSYVNKKTEDILGWPRGLLTDLDAYWTLVFPDPKVREHMVAGVEADWASGDPARMVREYAIAKQSGATAEILVVEIPIYDQGLLIGTFQDVTERRRAEREIYTLNQQLEERVAERTRELELANRELEAFTYSVSHDLRAPLRAIDGFGQALLEDYGERLDTEAKTYLGYLRDGCRDMNELIEGLLKLSRSVRGEMMRETVDLSVLGEEILAALRRADPKRQVKAEIASGVKVEADPRLLKVVMENLLGNAWKYTQHTAGARIAFGSARRQGETVYFVRDNGAGFDMAYADKLFRPFQRLHSLREFSGLGVGLATVQRIIHRHGGRIWAEAAVGEGASFFFTLGTEAKDHG